MKRFVQLGAPNLIYLAQFAPLDEVLALCESEPSLKRLICESETFWRQRAEQDFGSTLKQWNQTTGTPRERYDRLKQRKMIIDGIKEIVPGNFAFVSIDRNTGEVFFTGERFRERLPRSVVRPGKNENRSNPMYVSPFLSLIEYFKDQALRKIYSILGLDDLVDDPTYGILSYEGNRNLGVPLEEVQRIEQLNLEIRANESRFN